MTSRRWDRRSGRVAAITVVASMVLIGCSTTSTERPSAVAATSASPASTPSSPEESVAAGSIEPEGALPPTLPAESSSTMPVAASETDVWVPAGDHRVPGTLTMPTGSSDQQVPAVLLLHGDLSNRDENGDMFVRLAAALAARGIASLRIDFAGSGDSEEPDIDLSYPNMVDDATAAMDYLAQDASVDPARIAVLGLSRGGSIAATLAGTIPGVAALVSWSGAVSNGVDEDPESHDEARENGWVTVDLGDREFRLAVGWFDTIEASHPLDDVAGYLGPVLAVVGSDDDIVDPETSEVFLDTVATEDKTLHVIEGGDHGYTAEQEYGDEAIAVTTDWLVTRLSP